MIKLRSWSFIFAACLGLGLSSTASAALLGLDLSPRTSPVLTGHGYAIWDSFTTTNAQNAAPSTFDGSSAAGGAAFSANLDFNMTGGFTTGSGDRIYSAQPPTFTPVAYNFQLDITALQAISALTIQVKFTSPDAADFMTFFNPTLNSQNAVKTYLGTTVEATGDFNVVSYSWTGLNIAANNSFAIQFASLPNHVSLDAIMLSTVPEPSRAMLAVASIGFLAFRRRRSKKAE